VTRKPDTRAALRDKITDALMRDVGISEHLAQPFVDSIMRCFAGEQPYFPSSSRDYPTLHIRAALERGTPVKVVMREYKVSRSMLHKLFPGGLPRSNQKAG
jgi:hypothetical protein